MDFLRGFAALCVCYYHFSSLYPYPCSLLRLTGAYGSFGVQIFFVISGIVIPYSLHKSNYSIRYFKTFLVKRIIRIEPPYLASIAIVLLLGYLISLSPYWHGTPFSVDLLNLLGHIGYVNSFFKDPKWINSVYWTLAIEFQYYILIGLTFSFFYAVKKITWVSVFILFNLVGIFIGNHNLIFAYSAYFTIGLISYKFIVKTITVQEFLFYLLILFPLAFLKHHTAGLIAAIIPVVFVFFTVDNRLSRFFGNISYSLYLLHVPIGMNIIILAQPFVKGLSQFLLLMVVALAITLLVSYLFYLYIELPCKKWAKKIQYGSVQNNMPVGLLPRI